MEEEEGGGGRRDGEHGALREGFSDSAWEIHWGSFPRCGDLGQTPPEGLTLGQGWALGFHSKKI